MDLHPITLDRLWRASETIELAGHKLVIRALSSYEIKCRFDEATLATLQVRKDVKQPDSRYYQLNIQSTLEAATDDELRALVVRGTSGQATGEAVRDIQPEYVAYPDDASDEERADTLAARQAQIDKANKLRTEYVVAKTKAKETEVMVWDRPALEKEYVRLAIATLLDNTWGEVYNNAGLLYAVRKEDGSPYFASLQDVAECDDRIRQRLSFAVRSINEIDPLGLSGQSSTATPPVAGS